MVYDYAIRRVASLNPFVSHLKALDDGEYGLWFIL